QPLLRLCQLLRFKTRVVHRLRRGASASRAERPLEVALTLTCLCALLTGLLDVVAAQALGRAAHRCGGSGGVTGLARLLPARLLTRLSPPLRRALLLPQLFGELRGLTLQLFLLTTKALEPAVPLLRRHIRAR